MNILTLKSPLIDSILSFIVKKTNLNVIEGTCTPIFGTQYSRMDLVKFAKQTMSL